MNSYLDTSQAVPTPNNNTEIDTQHINNNVLITYFPRTVSYRCHQRPSLSPVAVIIMQIIGQNKITLNTTGIYRQTSVYDWSVIFKDI